MGGRPRKPTALKLLHGDFDKNPQRRNAEEPQPKKSAPKCPAHLSDVAKDEWRRIVKELQSMDVVTQVDRSALEAYAVLYASWRDAIKTVSEEGAFLDSETGKYEHPASKAARQLASEMHKVLCQFGLTPASRSRVHVQKTTEEVRMRRTR